jgi:Transglycosylase-like domain
MHKRLLSALMPVAASAALVVGVAQFGTADAGASPQRRDELSAKRPAAASSANAPQLAPYGIAQASAETAIGAVYSELQRAQLDAIAAELARQGATPPAGSAGGASAAAADIQSGSSGNGFLDCVKQRESHGTYETDTGNGYHGAYQFAQSTWDNTAADAGRADLVGADPAQVAPSDQDAMAEHLYSTAGSSPWGGYCG